MRNREKTNEKVTILKTEMVEYNKKYQRGKPI
jgi:hypothetical protein